MACDFCKGKTVIRPGSFDMKMEDGELEISYECTDPWYSGYATFEPNHCMMCGEKLGGDA